MGRDSGRRKEAQAIHSRARPGRLRARSWDEVNEIIAAANVYTIKKYGPDRIFGFSPIPAMSHDFLRRRRRYLSLIGGACMSFYDWYCDLPPACPQIWGEQTDVPESADWYNSTYIIVCGSNLPPDAHAGRPLRHRGALQGHQDRRDGARLRRVRQASDLWMPPNPGTDAARLAMGHVALKEFYHRQAGSRYFHEYARKYTDLPIQVMLAHTCRRRMTCVRPLPARFRLRRRLGETNNPDWKTIVFDEKASPLLPNGSIGFRWGEKGKWNLLPKKRASSRKFWPNCPASTQQEHEVVDVGFPHFGERRRTSPPTRRTAMSPQCAGARV